MNQLNAAWQAAATEIYQATGGAGGAGAQPGADQNASAGSAPNSNDVSDVEYEEVNDNKK
jgi:molecular chaperone DnaK